MCGNHEEIPGKAKGQLLICDLLGSGSKNHSSPTCKRNCPVGRGQFTYAHERERENTGDSGVRGSAQEVRSLRTGLAFFEPHSASTPNLAPECSCLEWLLGTESPSKLISTYSIAQ